MNVSQFSIKSHSGFGKETFESDLLIDGLYDIFDELDELAGFDDVVEAIL